MPWTAARRRSVLVGVALGVVATVGTVGALAASGGDDGPAASTAGAGTVAGAAGERLPDTELTRSDGSSVRLRDFAGTPMVVNFFASWCAPCVREMPDFEQVHQRLGDTVAFLGINVNDPSDEGAKLAQRTGITYDWVRDPRGDALNAIGAVVMPTTVFVDADGTIVEVHSGQLDADALAAKVSELLGVAA